MIAHSCVIAQWTGSVPTSPTACRNDSIFYRQNKHAGPVLEEKWRKMRRTKRWRRERKTEEDNEKKHEK
jgi:hypothetical protein